MTQLRITDPGFDDTCFIVPEDLLSFVYSVNEYVTSVIEAMLLDTNVSFYYNAVLLDEMQIMFACNLGYAFRSSNPCRFLLMDGRVEHAAMGLPVVQIWEFDWLNKQAQVEHLLYSHILTAAQLPDGEPEFDNVAPIEWDVMISGSRVTLQNPKFYHPACLDRIYSDVCARYNGLKEIRLIVPNDLCLDQYLMPYAHDTIAGLPVMREYTFSHEITLPEYDSGTTEYIFII